MLVTVVVVVAGHVALVAGVVAVVRAFRRSGATADVAADIPYQDLHPVASYLYAMCGVGGQQVSDFAHAAGIWLTEGRIVLPAGSRPLARRDRAGLPLPYAERPPAVEPVA